jgi:phosphatidylglycerophosphate synthase
MRSETSLPDSTAEPGPRGAAAPVGSKIYTGFLHVNRYLNRPPASLIVRALLRTRVTPNQVTVAAFFIGLAGAFAFSRGTPALFAVGGILAELSSIVDCADGMLARARGQMSEYGAYLDLILDRVNEFFLIAGAVLGYYAYSGSVRMLVLGLVTLSLYLLQVAIFYLTETYVGNGLVSRSAENRGLLLILIFLFGVVNRINLGIYVLFAETSVINLYFLYSFFRQARR